MGSETRELKNNIVHLETMKNVLSFSPLYLEDIDTLVFQPENPIPAISVDCDGDLLLRIDPKTREIVGIEIEDFEGYFITKYPSVAPAWKEMKNTIKKRKCNNENLAAFLTIVKELLDELIKKDDCIELKPVLPSGQPALFLT